MNPYSHNHRPCPPKAEPLPPFPKVPYPRIPPQPQPQPHLHSPTLDAVIEALYLEDGISSTDEAVRLVDSLRPPVECVTLGDLFAHVRDEPLVFGFEHEGARDMEHDDACEICGVRCSSTAYAPFPGLCVRCTAKVQHLQREKGGAR